MGRKRLDITNEIYGRLQTIVIDWYRTNQGKGTYWWCQCECGNIISVQLGHLKNGSIKSCGCLCRLDITNEIYGRLKAIVTDWYKTKKTGQTHWFCQCEDNNIVSVYLGSLKNGHTQSCGCLRDEKTSKRSSGENNPNWKNGITPFYTKIRMSTKHLNFVQIALKKANYTCQLSNEKSKGDLQVHHIKGFAKILEENNKELRDEKNVIVLSEKWHTGIKTDNPYAFHRLYGFRSFIEEDFYEWFNKFSIIEKALDN